MKKVLVASGTSVHKLEFAVGYIRDYLAKKGVEAEVVGDNIYELHLDVTKPDVIVTIGPVNFTTAIPLVAGAAFVTKIGMDPVCDDIIGKLRS
ncbi:MAG: hypothetical protein LBN92_04230 [Treponema sp.]|jgi:PTS system galactitol-specific IIB component|nr:hypothetical protein [Treponema sp.]